MNTESETGEGRITRVRDSRTAIAQFRYIKIQLKAIDTTTRLRGLIEGFMEFIPLSLEMMPIAGD